MRVGVGTGVGVLVGEGVDGGLVAGAGAEVGAGEGVGVGLAEPLDGMVVTTQFSLPSGLRIILFVASILLKAYWSITAEGDALL